LASLLTPIVFLYTCTKFYKLQKKPLLMHVWLFPILCLYSLVYLSR